MAVAAASAQSAAPASLRMGLDIVGIPCVWRGGRSSVLFPKEKDERTAARQDRDA